MDFFLETRRECVLLILLEEEKENRNLVNSIYQA